MQDLGLTVDVRGASVVVPGHERVKGGNAISVRRLHAAERGAHQDRRVIGITHSGVALDTDVDTLFHQ